jgi:hypothetical protein
MKRLPIRVNAITISSGRPISAKGTEATAMKSSAKR